MFINASNKCQWLKYRTDELCNKNCIGTYCAVHNAQIKRGMRTFPCKVCGTGINHNGICVKCVGVSAYQKFLRAKRLTKIKLMEEIKEKVQLIE